ncbi:energy transducer TonB [Flavobacterium psychrotolerans]|uniref:TonB C-terminal domain-containing protein n=1 Tax=Flavobacterium psychrotolerans TaxID=2169410 RepID=A0A2U1JML5_9FLAO|nr:energy transducer TonB [Flavobacterium psychrotolerans]PWA06407.1 hypothetical protein DB895_03010 [Flavobacterium psychrotolerans]
MKYLLLLFLLFTFSDSGYSQGGEFDDVYGSDVINPKFNGGELDKFYEYINQEFDFSKVTKAGKMLVSITIDKIGALQNIRVVEFNDIESATEIIRVLNKAPNWECAKRGGKPFSIEMKIPFEFNLKFKPGVSNTQNSKSAQLSEKNISNSQKFSDSVRVSTAVGIKKVSNEKPPEFSSGLTKFYQFINENYRTPSVEGLKGKVIVSFIVDIDGSLTDFVIVKDLGYGTGKEAIRVLKKCPKWSPGTQNGIPIRCVYSLPINIHATSN